MSRKSHVDHWRSDLLDAARHRRMTPSWPTPPSTARPTGPAHRRGSSPATSIRARACLVARRRTVLLRRVLVSGRAFGEEGGSVEGTVTVHPTFDDHIDAIRKGIGRDSAVDHRKSVCAVSHTKRILAPSRVPLDGPWHDTSADL